MKKLLSIMAAMLVSAAMVSCGDITIVMPSDGNSVNDTQPDVEVDTTEEITPEEEQAVVEEEPVEEKPAEEEPAEKEPVAESSETVTRTVVDFDALAEIAAEDDCELKIVEKSVLFGSSGIGSTNTDYLIFTVKNNTGKEIVSANIYAVGYKGDGSSVTVQSISLSTATNFSFTDMQLPAGQIYDCYANCNATRFKSVEAIVAAYTTADGEEYQNPAAEKWLDCYETTKEVSVNAVQETLTRANLVNINALNSINDTCDIKIIETTIEEDSATGLALNGNDAMMFTFKNNGNEDVIALNVYVLGYTSDKKISLVQNSNSVGNIYDYMIYTFNNIELAAGEELEGYYANCDSSRFDETNVIVASYTTADGTVHENPAAEIWANSYIARTILD